jgi:type 1 fimbriae regulatory protein FimB/type 1 fimbriae regulatory protein FimE
MVWGVDCVVLNPRVPNYHLWASWLLCLILLHLKKSRTLKNEHFLHLLPNEVEAMIKAAKGTGRHGHRDATLILLAYRHGLRVSELVALRWEQVDFSSGTIYINRLKHGVSSTHPLRGPELRALRQLLREYPGSPYLFVRGAWNSNGCCHSLWYH